MKYKYQDIQKSEEKLKFPEYQAIQSQKYSLAPDMALGWKPNVLLKGPIPLQYMNN